jgi:hypothetical protein
MNRPPTGTVTFLFTDIEGSFTGSPFIDIAVRAQYAQQPATITCHYPIGAVHLGIFGSSGSSGNLKAVRRCDARVTGASSMQSLRFHCGSSLREFP